jgi:hypothetical protein
MEKLGGTIPRKLDAEELGTRYRGPDRRAVVGRWRLAAAGERRSEADVPRDVAEIAPSLRTAVLGILCGGLSSLAAASISSPSRRCR